jgi:hypothetical protein
MPFEIPVRRSGLASRGAILEIALAAAHQARKAGSILIRNQGLQLSDRVGQRRQ